MAYRVKELLYRCNFDRNCLAKNTPGWESFSGKCDNWLKKVFFDVERINEYTVGEGIRFVGTMEQFKKMATVFFPSAMITNCAFDWYRSYFMFHKSLFWDVFFTPAHSYIKFACAFLAVVFTCRYLKNSYRAFFDAKLYAKISNEIHEKMVDVATCINAVDEASKIIGDDAELSVLLATELDELSRIEQDDTESAKVFFKELKSSDLSKSKASSFTLKKGTVHRTFCELMHKDKSKVWLGFVERLKFLGYLDERQSEAECMGMSEA